MWLPKYLLVVNQPIFKDHLLDVGLIIIDLHMAIIQMHEGKNIMEDVLLDGGLYANIIIEFIFLN
jgi:hypothetical protein